LTLDHPDKSVNTMGQRYIASMDAVLERLAAERESITGVVVTSAKKTFPARDEPDVLSTMRSDGPAGSFAGLQYCTGSLPPLGTIGLPVVRAVNGSALGGGLELALACHHRVVADDAKLELGFPEVSLGLLPGAGGVVRTVRLLGLATALTELLLRGQRIKPAKALELGLVHEVVPRDELLDRARAWIATNPSSVQPWDAKGYKVPGGTTTTPALAM